MADAQHLSDDLVAPAEEECQQQGAPEKLKSGDTQFFIGQLVWAKMKGFSSYPAKVVDERSVDCLKGKKRPKKQIPVMFFPSYAHAFVPIADVLPFFRFREQREASNKAQAMKSALSATEDYIKEHPEVTMFEEEVEVSEEQKQGLQYLPPQAPNGKAAGKSGKKNKKRVGKPEKEEQTEAADAGNDSRKKRQKRTPTPTESNTSKISPVPCVDSTTGPMVTNEMDVIDGHVDGESGQTEEEEGVKTLKTYPRVTAKKVGFIGFNGVGKWIVENLVKSGHSVTVCSQNLSDDETSLLLVIQRAELTKNDLKVVDTPKKVVEECDIILCLVNIEKQFSELFCGEEGIAKGFRECHIDARARKAYVELSTVSGETVNKCRNTIHMLGGRYLEAPVHGSVDDAMTGKLLYYCSGNKQVFNECHSIFQSTGEDASFLGDKYGTATSFKSAMDMLKYGFVACAAEACSMLLSSHIPESACHTLIRDFCANQPAKIADLIISETERRQEGASPKMETCSDASAALNTAVEHCTANDVACAVTTAVQQKLAVAKVTALGAEEAYSALMKVSFLPDEDLDAIII